MKEELIFKNPPNERYHNKIVAIHIVVVVFFSQLAPILHLDAVLFFFLLNVYCTVICPVMHICYIVFQYTCHLS